MGDQVGNALRRPAVLAAVAAVVVLLVVAVIYDSGQDDHIAKGVRVGNVDVGGMDAGEARALVTDRLGKTAQRPLVVTFRKERWELPAAQSGARLDADATIEAARQRSRQGNAVGRTLTRIEGSSVDATITPRVTYDQQKVDAWIKRIAGQVDRPAKDADIDVKDGKLSRQGSQNGLDLQQPMLQRKVAAQLDAAGARATITAPVKVDERADKTLPDLAKKYPTVIAIDRDAKQLRLYKGLKLQHKYQIAVGQQGLESSPGRYKIEAKQVDPPWHVPMSSWAGSLQGQTIPAGDPRNPLVARWMAYHDGQGIHGTKELDSLGSAASHGCIRMDPKDVKALYKVTPMGTPVFLQ